jgi:hypothetical protein
MKRIITLLLVLALTLSLCACGNSNPTDETGNADQTAADGLQAGYSRINITPSYSCGLAGYSDDDTRRSEGFRTYIYMTCVAVKSGADTVLLYTFDGLSASKPIQDAMRGSITTAVDIPADNIFIGATHCHSAPTLTRSYQGNDKYFVEFMSATAKAAQEAIADLAPAQMLATAGELTDENGKYMNFVRHYEMKDGSHAGSNFGDWSTGIVGHSAEADHELILLKFDRAEDKKDILMINFQAHPDKGTQLGRFQIAASWVGPLRDELEKLSGLQVAYFTGASGNQNPDSKIPEEAHGLDWLGYGTKMGQLINGKLADLKPVEGGMEFKQTSTQLELEIDHSWDHMLAQANEVYDLWKSADKTAGDALGKQYGFTSSYQARAIRSRASMSKTGTLEVRAFKLGPIGFTTGTYEMFSTHSLYVKEHSPFDITFIITANSSYLPDAAAYDYRSYEADTGYYAKGSGEKLAENYVKMLNEIK